MQWVRRYMLFHHKRHRNKMGPRRLKTFSLI
ncbi:hypothetical protein [Leptolyngbya sp. FACHB-261]|nr:hypothetical protein [Leptolyngbya sp. FACHB-261]